MVRRPKPSLTDVAREAGVSIATVSRAMSMPELLRADTLASVRTAAARLGYRPDRAARTLASGRSNTVGVVVPTLNSPIFSSTLQEMQRGLATAGYQMLVASDEYDPAGEYAAIDKLLAYGIEGLAIVGASRPKETWNLIGSAGIPVIQMWCGQPEHACIGVDNYAAGKLIAEYIVALGHERIGVVTGHLQNNDRQRDRLRGIVDALTCRGITLHDAYRIEESLSVPGGRAACRQLLQLPERPTAVIAAVDVIAIGIMAECRTCGISIPEEMSVGGIDNIELSTHVSPSLTTVNIPSTYIGKMTATRILELISLGADARHIILPTELIIRSSVISIERH